MAAKKETMTPAPVVSDKKKALETAMQQIEKCTEKAPSCATAQRAP